MTAHQQQIRRDTATNLNAATPAEGELGFDTTNKRIVCGDGSTAGGIAHVSANDLQTQSFTNSTVGGTANAITLSNSPAIGSYVSGLRLSFKATSTNTGAVTVDVDSLGTKNVKKLLDGSLQALSAGDIVSGVAYDIQYDGTQFQIKGLGNTSPQPSGLVLLGTQTASSSASLDFTSVITSTYDNYLIVLNNLIPASGGNLLLRTSGNNGSSFDAGSTDYVWGGQTRTVGGAPTLNPEDDGDSAIKVAISVSSTTALGGVCGEIKLYNPLNASSRKGIHFDTSYNASTGSRLVVYYGAGQRQPGSPAAIDAIRLLMDSGNIASGTARIYGISKT